MLHAMIDVETLGVGINAPIFEIGLVVFGMESGFVEFTRIDLDIMDVMFRTGFAVQQDTLDWWRKQSYDPSLTPLEGRYSLVSALDLLKKTLQKHEVSHVWANSPTFDLILLQRHYEAIKETVPWTYKQELDFRTMRWMHRAFEGADPTPEETVGEPTHNALRDALDQTLILMAAMKGANHV